MTPRSFTYEKDPPRGRRCYDCVKKIKGPWYKNKNQKGWIKALCEECMEKRKEKGWR